jgi:hypothetical protein
MCLVHAEVFFGLLASSSLSTNYSPSSHSSFSVSQFFTPSSTISLHSSATSFKLHSFFALHTLSITHISFPSVSSSQIFSSSLGDPIAPRFVLTGSLDCTVKILETHSGTVLFSGFFFYLIFHYIHYCFI